MQVVNVHFDTHYISIETWLRLVVELDHCTYIQIIACMDLVQTVFSYMHVTARKLISSYLACIQTGDCCMTCTCSDCIICSDLWCVWRIFSDSSRICLALSYSQPQRSMQTKTKTWYLQIVLDGHKQGSYISKKIVRAKLNFKADHAVCWLATCKKSDQFHMMHYWRCATVYIE